MSWFQRLRRGCRLALGNPADQFAHGIVFAEDGKHRHAFREFAYAGRCGLPAAQFRLGRCYLFGLGVTPCIDAAMCWLTQAAEHNNVEAQTLLVSLALQGISPRVEAGLFEANRHHTDRLPDYQAAVKWGARAAEAGSAEAQALLGYIFSSGPNELRNLSRAAQYYRQAADVGFAQGQLGWALLLIREDNSEAARAEASRLLKIAAEADLPAAHLALGILTEQTALDVDQLAAAATHYRNGAIGGNRSAQVRFGIALLNGRGVKQDKQDGETWLRRAGLAGDPLAAAIVGDLYAHAGSMPPNFFEAAQWFQRAAEAGHVGAARALGQLCLHGGGFGTDPVLAVHWLRVAATAGDAAAAYDLGVCLVHGIGTPRDDTEAVLRFHCAIEVIPAARYWYARMLAEGRGITQDLPTARTCFLRAATEGNGDAAVAAGEMLVNGRGGPADRTAAMRLFTGAAMQGHKGAHYALSVLEPAGSVPVSGGECITL